MWRMCIPSWPGWGGGLEAESTRKINACGERLFSAVRCPELGNRVFLCRINERAFHGHRDLSTSIPTVA